MPEGLNGDFGRLYDALKSDFVRLEGKVDAALAHGSKAEKDTGERLSVVETRVSLLWAAIGIVSVAFIGWVVTRLLGA